MTQKLKFTVEDAKVINENPSSNFAILDLDFFASGENLHEMYVSEETLLKTADSIKNCPLVWEYDDVLDDVGTHNRDEVPCGFVPESSTVQAKKLPDGRTMLSVVAYVWKRYTGEILNFFKRDGGKKPVSVEMSVYNTKTLPNGLIELLDFKYDAITVLGSFVKPAIPSAMANVLSFAEIKTEYKKVLKEEFSEIDMLIPEDVKSNAKEGLELRKKFNKGGTASSLAFARYLINNRTASPESIKQIAEHFSQHKRDALKQNPSSDIDWMLWGGTASKEWTELIVDELNKKEEIEMSELVTFPYKSMKDVNPSLKSIEPPISLAQANAIAKQADAIGSNDKKNGWAIAISSFKKGHTVQDGQWVKKEAMSEGEAAWADDNVITKEFAKEDLGKGSTISVDKSKEKVSNTPWGSVDKTALQHKVLGASNYKSLVNDVYLIVETGWEDHPSSSLKYPVMQLVGGTFVYNAGGLSAALGRAKGQGESAAASKAESTRNKLGLGEPDKKEEVSVANTKEEMAKKPVEGSPEEEKKESPEVEKKEELAAVKKPVEGSPAEEKKEAPEEEKKEEMAIVDNNIVEERKYIEKKKAAEEKNVAEEKKAAEDNKTAEEKAETIEEQKIELLELASKKPAEGSPAEEKKETSKEEKKEDVAIQNKEEEGKAAVKGFAYPKGFKETMHKLFVDDDSDEVKMAKEEMAKDVCDPEIMIGAMHTKMLKMAVAFEKLVEDNKAYMAENEELKKFKAAELVKEKFSVVDGFLADMAGKVVIPEESMAEFRTNSEKFSLEQIDAWKNECKAKSFDFAVKETSETKVTRVAFPHSNTTWRKSGNDPWAGTK